MYRMYRGQVLSGDVNVSAVSPDGKAGRDSRFRDSGGPVACGRLLDRLFSGRCTLGAEITATMELLSLNLVVLFLGSD